MNIVDSHNIAPIPNDIPSSIADSDFSFKSPLMNWFRINRSEFEQAFSGLKQRNWEAVAAQATAAGIRNGHDRPVTRGSCRQAWYRLTRSAATMTVGKDVARDNGDEAAPPRQSAQGSQVLIAYGASESTSTEVWSSFAGDDLGDQNIPSTERTIQPGRKRNSDGLRK